MITPNSLNSQNVMISKKNLFFGFETPFGNHCPKLFVPGIHHGIFKVIFGVCAFQPQMINLTSDNCTGAHPSISEALLRHSTGSATAYGESDLDRKIEKTFDEIFEHEVAVYFVGTGTAANALSMAYVNRAGGIIFAHRHAYLIEDECGAPEYFTGGARLFGVSGGEGRICPEALEEAIRRYDPAVPDNVHAGRPMAVSITQSTESGTLYSLAQIRQIARIAHAHGIPLHMDGARFANAMESLGCSPAEMSWKSGVDILSFGASKNGCWCAEAILVFNDLQHAHTDFPYLRKRAAHLFSKTRFIAAQFEAYFQDGLWTRNARHANNMSFRLAALLRSLESDVRLAWTPQANEVFVVMRRGVVEALWATGRVAPFYEWPHGRDECGELGQDEALYRLVTSFATQPEEVDEFGTLLAEQCQQKTNNK